MHKYVLFQFNSLDSCDICNNIETLIKNTVCIYTTFVILIV